MKHVTLSSASIILAFALVHAKPIFATIIELNMPFVELDRTYVNARGIFETKISDVVRPLNQSDSQGLTVFAPFGGTKISPFAQLDADGLVIMGWERPGSLVSIEKAFGIDRQVLSSSLASSQSAGAMSSIDVLAVSLSAQILGRLFLELGVTSIVMSQYVTKDSALVLGSEEKILSQWDGETVTDSDDLLFTQFTFQWRGKPREILFVTYKIANDKASSLRETGAIASNQLKKLLGGTSGFKWGYVSADGMALFSGTNGNGFEQASKDLLGLLRKSGGVILDYPTLATYNTPQIDGDAIWMGGRSDLSNFGLTLVASLPLKKPLFGYSGFAADDSVKIYRKPMTGLNAKQEVSKAPVFTVAHLHKVGATTTFRLVVPSK